VAIAEVHRVVVGRDGHDESAAVIDGNGGDSVTNDAAEDAAFA
jgi:hypothetical protein